MPMSDSSHCNRSIPTHTINKDLLKQVPDLHITITNKQNRNLVVRFWFEFSEDSCFVGEVVGRRHCWWFEIWRGDDWITSSRLKTLKESFFEIRGQLLLFFALVEILFLFRLLINVKWEALMIETFNLTILTIIPSLKPRNYVKVVCVVRV